MDVNHKLTIDMQTDPIHPLATVFILWESPATTEKLDPIRLKTVYTVKPEDKCYHGHIPKQIHQVGTGEGNYADGVLHGVREIYFPNGK